jgi:hypothetical protein
VHGKGHLFGGLAGHDAGGQTGVGQACSARIKKSTIGQLKKNGTWSDGVDAHSTRGISCSG